MPTQKKIEKILTKFTTGVNRKVSGLLNIDFTNEGHIVKRKGWRTFDEMVWTLLDINNRYKKMGYQGDFTIRLPLNRSRGKKKYINYHNRKSR